MFLAFLYFLSKYLASKNVDAASEEIISDTAGLVYNIDTIFLQQQILSKYRLIFSDSFWQSNLFATTTMHHWDPNIMAVLDKCYKISKWNFKIVVAVGRGSLRQGKIILWHQFFSWQ